MSISVEIAEQDLERFIDLMGIDTDPTFLDEEETSALQAVKAKLVRAVVAGSLVIGETGEPVFTPQRLKDANPITFYEPTGATLMAMDRKKKGEDVGKMYASMASLTHESAKTFSNMPYPDLKVCIALTTLFLG